MILKIKSNSNSYLLKADFNNLKEEVQYIKGKYKELETKLKLYIENHHNTDENQKGNGKNDSLKNENNNPQKIMLLTIIELKNTIDSL